ncbi:MAG: hypothetical protein U9N84_07025 [Actinomycetota bacterium]|nr:hypothetical protein [Actinomycetota bacterium]
MVRTTAPLGAILLASCVGSGTSEPPIPTSPQEVTASDAPTSVAVSPTTVTATTAPVDVPVETGAGVVSVPPGQPVVIDGVLGEREWDGAVAFEMSDGATLWLMYTGETLYVAVEGIDLGAVNVVIGTVDKISILHSSAALGSALYEPGLAEWDLAHGFRWCCRDRNDDAARLDLLAEEGWQANIGYTGTAGIVEYEIAIPWRGASMAVSSIRSADDTGFWPLELSASAREQLLGAPPDTRSYDTSAWYTIEPGNN